jgi:peptidoglycan/LPS O-acetylase OafA/YrhL
MHPAGGLDSLTAIQKRHARLPRRVFAGPAADRSATSRSLAGLMALSVIAIFAHHAAVPQYFPGDLGVVTFLLAAGYGLSVTLLAARPWSRSSLRVFWIRHLGSTYPLFVVLVMAFAFAATTLSHSFGRYLGQAAAVLTFTVNVFASGNVNMGSFLHLWPFAMEEQWFLVMALATLWLARRAVADSTVVRVLLALAALSSVDEIATHAVFRPDAQLAPLALAMAVAWSRRAGLGGWLGFAPSARLAASAGLGILVVLVWGTVAQGSAASLRIPAVTWLGLIVLAHITRPGVSGPVVAFLGSGMLATAGSFAIAFYLWHYPMLHLIGARPDRGVGIVLALLASAAAAVASQLALNYGTAVIAAKAHKHSNEALAA